MSTHYLRLLRWHNQAACADANPDVFSPVIGDERRRVNLPLAREVARTWCGGCPVLAECRADVDARRRKGWGPQELVEAGVWWPSTNSRGEPIDLLADLAEPTSKAA